MALTRVWNVTLDDFQEVGTSGLILDLTCVDTTAVDPIPTFTITGMRPPDGSNLKQIVSSVTRILLEKETRTNTTPQLVKGQTISLTVTPPTPTEEQVDDGELSDRINDVSTAQKIVSAGVLVAGTTDYNGATMPLAQDLLDTAIGRYHVKLDEIIAKRGYNATQVKLYIASLF